MLFWSLIHWPTDHWKLKAHDAHWPNDEDGKTNDYYIREDIFWGKGKNMSEATEEERMADLGERLTFDIIVIVILVIGIVVIGIS